MSWSMKSHGQSKPTKKGVEKNGPSRSSTNYALTDPFVGIPSFSFFFFPRREAINLRFFQSFVPPFSKTTRPRWFVRSTWGRGRRVSHLHPLATVTWKPVPKSGRIASRQGWRGHGLLSCAILVNSLLLQGWKKGEFSFLKFSRAHPGR